ncbi:MAG: hypothetical protein J6N49_05040 [Alphaproteobacteria bacterium]|nr:hypothetical protein [Alphaproteobacteria bacterium]
MADSKYPNKGKKDKSHPGSGIIDKIRDNALIFGTAALIGTGFLGRFAAQKYFSDSDYQAKKELAELNKKLSKTYKITDEASFKQLYEDALPLAQLTMFPTEVLVLNAYSDNGGKVSNTIGLGSYWYPADGNPYSSRWVATSKYARQHKKLRVTGDKALQLADGWCRYREGGRIYKAMYNRLKGCELKINEFAALYSRVYNSEKYGLEVCSYVHDNYRNPVKCAYKIMCFQPGAKFRDGIIKRDASEALFYLNHNGYVSKMGELKVKKGINSKGNTYYVTSVTQLNPAVCEEMRNGLARGNLAPADKVCRQITQYMPKGGRSVRQIINSEIKDADTRDALLKYDSQTANYAEVKADKDYQKAMEKYASADYEGTLAILQGIVNQGFDGADIHNDMAITQYHLGHYDDCIAECRKVLNTGETEFYAAANYNAGLAYEQKGDKDRALMNYKLAQNRNPDRPEYKNAVMRLSPKPVIKPKVKTTVERNVKIQKKATSGGRRNNVNLPRGGSRGR